MVATSVRHRDARITRSHKTAEAEINGSDELRVLPATPGAGLCRLLTISPVIQFSHPERRLEREIPAIGHDGKTGAEEHKCFFPH